jgi:hypothetical protein
MRLSSSSNVEILDCAQTCMKSLPCYTAVLNKQARTCALYAAIADDPGNSLIQSNATFITIIVEKQIGTVIERV